MDEIRYPALPQCEPLEGSEPIRLGNRQLATMQDFWRWAYSNVNDNASRGRFAEYLVCAALGCAQGTRTEWDPYDILWNGVKVEVKSSAYLQTWAQRELSRISFGIQPTRFWDPKTNTEDETARRQADVYVFCIENCMDQTAGNPNANRDASESESRIRLEDRLAAERRERERREVEERERRAREAEERARAEAERKRRAEAEAAELERRRADREREEAERLAREEAQRVEAEERAKIDVIEQLRQQEFQARDPLGRRWVMCERCGEAKLVDEFMMYGGAGRVNLGVCYDCGRKRSGG